jgi:hypothetical protein
MLPEIGEPEGLQQQSTLFSVISRVFGNNGELCKLLISLGERAGTRTQDLLIKSQLLYRLSYALP